MRKGVWCAAQGGCLHAGGTLARGDGWVCACRSGLSTSHQVLSCMLNLVGGAGQTPPCMPKPVWCAEQGDLTSDEVDLVRGDNYPEQVDGAAVAAVDPRRPRTSFPSRRSKRGWTALEGDEQAARMGSDASAAEVTAAPSGLNARRTRLSLYASGRPSLRSAVVPLSKRSTAMPPGHCTRTTKPDLHATRLFASCAGTTRE
jgi:hypothetical protein